VFDKIPPVPTQKPREKPKRYQRKPKVPVLKDAPKTSARMVKEKHKNLTLHDWMMVFAFIDQHPGMTQGDDIMKHFASKSDGALSFNQCTLSRKIKSQEELKKHITSHPNALSSKCPRVVTRPDVERALILWVRHMEEKGETVNGPMLKAKRLKFEEQFDVPEAECLSGDGWIAPFCKVYGYKERRRHGEAGSVDLEAVREEQKRVGMILATYAERDRWNGDESSLFAL
jgi:hypothetical protein